MEAADVIRIYAQLERAGIVVWIDGGWGVDALLGQQTRPHKDLDIAIQKHDLPRFRDLLAARGYQEIKRETARPHNFVLGDAAGREIDVHVVELDAEGNGIYGPRGNGEMYPAASLTGTGGIGTAVVRCISPEWMVRFHNGYELTDKDLRDVSALCDRFGLALPGDYQRFAANQAK